MSVLPDLSNLWIPWDAEDRAPATYEIRRVFDMVSDWLGEWACDPLLDAEEHVDAYARLPDGRFVFRIDSTEKESGSMLVVPTIATGPGGDWCTHVEIFRAGRPEVVT